MKLIFSILLVISAASCMAQLLTTDSLSDAIDCKYITESSQVDDCVHMNMMSSKLLLSSELISIEERVKQDYSADPELGEELVMVVREAQEAWAIFRDKNCEIDAFEVEKKSPAYLTTINNCVIRMNNERIQELKNLLR